MILHGRNLIIKANGVAIAAARSCDITIAVDDIETSSATDGQWKTSMLGRKSWKVNTNHLVPSMARAASMAGTTVALSVELKGDMGGLAFDGFCDNVTIQQSSVAGDVTILWDKTLNKFVARTGNAIQGYLYYQSWSGGTAYMEPSDYDIFVCDGVIYTWYGNTLAAEKMSGNAHCLTWKCTATIGNLMQGSFEFKGTGPLTPASLPSTT